jgi:hypothetical protein
VTGGSGDQTWSAAPFTIHVDRSAEILAEQTRASGGVVIRLSLAGLSPTDQLCDRMADVFEFPYPSSGLDGALDLVSDLEWLELGAGLLVVVDAREARPTVLADLAGILPGVVDRWRSGDLPFVVAFDGLDDRSVVLESLAAANAALDEAGSLPWARADVAAVPIVTDP